MNLSERLALACQVFQLGAIEPFPNLSYHFVARALRDGEPVVLKLGVPHPEFSQEAEALTAFNGFGCVHLLDFDPSIAAMLLEDIRPGLPLEQTWTEAEDEVHTMRIAEAMLELWSAPATGDHPTVEHWLRCLDEGQPLLPGDLVERARAIRDELLQERTAPKLLHGDLHHGNLLQSKTGFTAIDPKGVVGDPAFEVYALLHNPVGAPPESMLSLLPKRLETVSDVTGIELGRLKAWGFCGLVMSLCWSAEEGEVPMQEVGLARELAKIT
jgi:streptomycin 6-kinase